MVLGWIQLTLRDIKRRVGMVRVRVDIGMVDG
jgi:hypothetical protein